MKNEETCLEVNDYLDLFILAGNLGDKQWQQEIIVKLQNRQTQESQNDESATLDHLWTEYKKINKTIHELYSQLQSMPSNHDLQEIMWNLKQRRIELGRKINNMEERRA